MSICLRRRGWRLRLAEEGPGGARNRVAGKFTGLAAALGGRGFPYPSSGWPAAISPS
jgi:hypothetical protein